MIKEQDFRSFNYNVLGPKSKIIGDLILQGDTIITSHIEGNLILEGDSKLILERGSFVKGKIKAQQVEVFGEVDGQIDCPGSVSIRSSAQVTGEIKAGQLTIYPGAIIEGQSSSNPSAV